MSPAWIEALDARLRAAERGSAPSPLTVQYVVETAGATVEYHVVLGPEHDSAYAGTAENPDVTFAMNAATALKVSSGQLSTEEAFITGQLTIEGDPAPLIDAYRHNNDA